MDPFSGGVFTNPVAAAKRLPCFQFTAWLKDWSTGPNDFDPTSAESQTPPAKPGGQVVLANVRGDSERQDFSAHENCPGHPTCVAPSAVD